MIETLYGKITDSAFIVRFGEFRVRVSYDVLKGKGFVHFDKRHRELRGLRCDFEHVPCHELPDRLALGEARAFWDKHRPKEPVHQDALAYHTAQEVTG